jgi:hypothetical protein
MNTNHINSQEEKFMSEQNNVEAELEASLMEAGIEIPADEPKLDAPENVDEQPLVGPPVAAIEESSTTTEVPVETTAQRLTRELKEKHFPTLKGKTAAEDRKRLATQVDEGIISPIMLARLLDIVPQQVYQAIAKGKLPALNDNDTQKRRIKFDDAVRWAANYLDRKDLREAQKAQEEKVAAEG